MSKSNIPKRNHLEWTEDEADKLTTSCLSGRSHKFGKPYRRNAPKERRSEKKRAFDSETRSTKRKGGGGGGRPEGDGSKFLDRKSVRAKSLDRAIGKMMSIDLQPFSMVENKGFQLLLHTAEPRYVIPSHRYFSDNVIPSLYAEVYRPACLRQSPHSSRKMGRYTHAGLDRWSICGSSRGSLSPLVFSMIMKL